MCVRWMLTWSVADDSSLGADSKPQPPRLAYMPPDARALCPGQSDRRCSRRRGYRDGRFLEARKGGRGGRVRSGRAASGRLAPSYSLYKLTPAQETIDLAARAAGAMFYASTTYGFFGYVFADLGEEYEYVYM